MPRIDGERIGLAFDMRGCPNRCRHCWLGPGSKLTLSEADVRSCVSQFRSCMGKPHAFLRKLSVATWFREPDFSDDYRKLYDLESELSDGKPIRYELLSVWRLARDKDYAKWARGVGPHTCQISFFGLKETNDWFYRRQGAFDDAILASARLLEVGMKPRWQLFLTTKLIPDIPRLLDLIDHQHVRERVAALGAEFQLFLHLPDPDHEARRIEDLRPRTDQVIDLPEAILAATRKHLRKDVLWHTEAALHAELLRHQVHPKPYDAGSDNLWLYVCSNWDVFPNIGTLEPWWRLGNLREDTPEDVLRRYQEDDVLGLWTKFHQSPAELASSYGDPTGMRIYSSKEALLSLYHARHCETEWKRRYAGRREPLGPALQTTRHAHPLRAVHDDGAPDDSHA